MRPAALLVVLCAAAGGMAGTAAADPAPAPAPAAPSRADQAIVAGVLHEARGELAQAMSEYRRAQAEAFEHGDPTGEAAAKDHALALAWRVPTITFMVAAPPAGLVLELDGRRVPPTEWSHHELDPGHHTLVAWAPNRAPIQVALDLREAEHQSLPIDLGPAFGAPSDGPASPAAAAPTGAVVYTDPGRTRRQFGLATAGAGAALLAGTFAWCAHESTLYHRYASHPDDPNSVRRANDVVARVRYLGTGSFALSLGALVAGGVLYFGAPSRHAESLTVSPTATAGSYGLSLSGGF